MNNLVHAMLGAVLVTVFFSASALAQPPQELDDPSIPNWGGAIKFENADAPVTPPPADGRVHYRNLQLPASFPFSSAVVIGETIYLSGELGVDYETLELVEGGVAAETRQIFANYETTLNALGANLSDLVKCTVFLDDMEDYADMNTAYADALPDPKPARSTLGANGLALDAALEIECIAIRAGGAAQ